MSRLLHGVHAEISVLANVNNSLVVNFLVVFQSVLKVMLVVELVVIISNIAVLLCKSCINCNLLLGVLVIWIDKHALVVVGEEECLLNTLLSLIDSVFNLLLLYHEMGVLMSQEWAELLVMETLVIKSATSDGFSVGFNHLNFIVSSIGDILGIVEGLSVHVKVM